MSVRPGQANKAERGSADHVHILFNAGKRVRHRRRRRRLRPLAAFLWDFREFPEYYSELGNTPGPFFFLKPLPEELCSIMRIDTTQQSTAQHNTKAAQAWVAYNKTVRTEYVRRNG